MIGPDILKGPIPHFSPVPLLTGLCPSSYFIFPVNHLSVLCSSSMNAHEAEYLQLVSKGSSLVSALLGEKTSFRQTTQGVTVTLMKGPRTGAPLAEDKL